jgi:hypothetical protein
MTSSETGQTVYADADIPFKDIFNGKHGGHQGMIKYLESRQNQLSRHLSDDCVSEPDKQRVLLGISAMREAINLIGVLKKKPV